MRWRVWLAPALATLSLAWCVAVGWWRWITPVRYTGISNGIPSEGYRAFSEMSGLGPVPLMIPVVFAGLAVLAAWRGQPLIVGIAALLLAVFTFVSGFSIGDNYIPAVGLLVAAVLAFALGTGLPKQVPAER